MKVLITGDKGFVGSETKRVFDEKKIKYVGFDIMDGNDIRQGAKMDEWIAEEMKIGKIDVILHLAAIARFSEADKDPILAYETNVMGTKNIAAIAEKYGIRIVYASTGSIYMPIEEKPPITEEFKGRGNSVYGCAKYLGELYLRQYHSPWIILRYAHLYGREKRLHGLIGGFLERIERGLTPTLYGGKQSNDFTYIKDVAQANYLACTACWDAWNQVYNIGTGEEITSEIAGQLICRYANYKGGINKIEKRTVDPERFVYEISKARKMLGFKAAYSFENGLKDMFEEKKLEKAIMGGSNHD